MMTFQSLRFMFATLVCGLLLTGCGVYINISDTNSGTVGHDSNTKPVQEIMIQALKATVEKWQYTDGYAFVLPTGAQYQTYQNVYIGIGTGPTLDSDTGLPVIKIEEIRARGHVAEVDVSRPVDALYPDGPRQLVTVHMKSDPMSGWLANYVKTWLPGVGDLNQEVVAIDIEALRVDTVEPVEQEIDEEQPDQEQTTEPQTAEPEAAEPQADEPEAAEPQAAEPKSDEQTPAEQPAE